MGPAQTGTRYYCDSTTIKVIFVTTIELSLLRAGGGSHEWVQLRQGIDTIVTPLYRQGNLCNDHIVLTESGRRITGVGPAQTVTRYYCDSTTAKVILATTILSLLRVGGGSQE